MRPPELLWTHLAVPLLTLEIDRRKVRQPPLPRRLAPTDLFRARTGSQLAHKELLEKAAQGGINLYFVGDSSTRRWGSSDLHYRDFLANWNRSYFGWNAANIVRGSDTL